MNTVETKSEYYPPRARWYGGLLYPFFFLHRVLHLERFRWPAGLSFGQVVLSLVVPGFSFSALGRRTLSRTFFAMYGLGALLFVVALGYVFGNVGYGLMIGAHGTSIIYLQSSWLREHCGFGLRLALALGTMVALWGLVYAPVMNFVEHHLFMPLRVRGHVVVVQRLTWSTAIKRGDCIVYSQPEAETGDAHGGGLVIIRAGLGWGPVLATGGDRVQFSTNSFTVNHVTRPALPFMPSSGEVVVPEKHWFVWPELVINRDSNASASAIGALRLRMATVAEDQFIGKPFQRWFWRRQIL